MPRKLFRRFLPDTGTLRSNRWLRHFEPWLGHPNLWHLNRRSVAGGVATGLFAGLVPGPLQILSGALLAMVFRVNLPVAALTTLYTNPFTIVPLYILAWQLGHWLTLSESAQPAPAAFTLAGKGWLEWIPALFDWVLAMGKPLAIGLPVLASVLAVTGYLLTDIAWRLHVRHAWRKRRLQRHPSSPAGG